MLKIQIGPIERKVVATALYEQQAVWVLAGSRNGEAVVSPIGSQSGQLFFCHETELLQLAPIKTQPSPNQDPGQPQARPSEDPSQTSICGTIDPGKSQPSSEKTTPRTIDHARSFLRPNPSLWEEMEARWPIVAALCNDALYADTGINGFEDLVQQLENGVRSRVPREFEGHLQRLLPPVERSDKCRLPDRRKLITKAIRTFIAYRKAYYPAARWLWVNRQLSGFDRWMDRVIDWPGASTNV